MGASLALAALDAARRVRLRDAPTRLLVRMALSAVDSDPKPWSRLPMADRCAALGHDDTPSGRQAVKRAMRAIIHAKLAKLTGGGNRSGASRYDLTISEKGGHSEHPIIDGKGDTQRPEGGHFAPRKGASLRPPKEDGGDTEEETRASAPRPDPRCPRHRAVPHPPACHDCGRARRESEAYDAAEADAERARRRAKRRTLDPAAVQALADRFGGRYTAEMITEAAREQMPDDLSVGLRILANLGDDAADALARWDR